MSASTSSTRWPACARATARLLATVVLPSPGPVLVTTRLRPPSSVDENSTLVRRFRKASAKQRRDPGVQERRIRVAGVAQASAPGRGTAARGTSLISSGLLIRLSRYSKKNARPDREQAAAEEREQEVERPVRPGGPARHFGLVHHADVARLELRGHVGFLRPLQQVVEHLPVGVGVALQHAVVDPLAAERHRLALLLLERGRPGAAPATARRGTRCGWTATTLPISPCSLASVCSMADLTLIISGCFSPYFSPSEACVPLQLGELPLELLDERVREDGREGVERRAVVLDRLDLVVERLLLEPLGARPGHRGVQLRQLLHDDVLLVLERHRVGLLPVAAAASARCPPPACAARPGARRASRTPPWRRRT